MSHIKEQQTKKTITSQIQTEFFRILDRSTFQGLPNVFWSTNTISKIFWFVLSAVSYLYCATLVIGSILDYYKFEVVTRYENVFENQPLFPSVLICDHDTNRTECLFNKETLHKLSKSTSLECEIFNDNQNDLAVPIIPLSSQEYGSRSGLQLKLYSLNVTKGIEVFISNHSQNVLTDPRVISPGMRTTFVIKRIFEQRLPSPYNNCQMNVTGSEKLDALKKPYYQSECLVYCKFYLIAEKCQLLDKFLEFSYLYYISYEFEYLFNLTVINSCQLLLINKTENNYARNKIRSCEKICPLECNSFSFAISEFAFKLADGQFPRDYAELNIYYETFYYTVISQSAKISEDALWATIGGLIGLFLGASVLSLGEIIELMLNVAGIVFFSGNTTVVNKSVTNNLHIHVNKDEVVWRRSRVFKVKRCLVTKVQKYGILFSLKNKVRFDLNRLESGN